MRRLCTVLARGGSTGVPGKNLRLLGGVPLVAHSIRHARATGLFDAVAVSSDDPGILAVARAEGVDVLVERPVELATSSAPKLPAVAHCVAEAERVLAQEFDVVVDLDPTSPLRLPDDVRAVVELLEGSEATGVITVAPARRSPYFNLVEGLPDGTVVLVRPTDPPVVRRQDAPACYDMNASVYAWWRRDVHPGMRLFGGRTLAHVMPEERSLDIDTELDWTIVEFLHAARAAVGGAA